MGRDQLLNTEAAATALGVQPSTIYSYVSRGLLNPIRTSRTKGSKFHPDEINAFRVRTRRNSAPPKLGTLSTVSSVIGERLLFRGEDALELSRTKTFEEVAHFVATGTHSDQSGPWLAEPLAHQTVSDVLSNLSDGVAPADRMKVALAIASVADPLRLDLRAAATIATMQTLIATMVSSVAKPAVTALGDSSIAERLLTGLSTGVCHEQLAPVVDAALVLLCDHTLAPSTVAARIAAASHADPYSVVLTGLSVGSGSLHGSSSFAIERYLRALDTTEIPANVLIDPSGNFTSTPGFGHPVYNGRDPRAEAILELLRDLDTPRMRVIDELLTHVARRGYPMPNAHFALATLAYVGELRAGAAEALFITARSAGWVAHAIEEYQNLGGTVRHRASYLGALHTETVDPR